MSDDELLERKLLKAFEVPRNPVQEVQSLILQGWGRHTVRRKFTDMVYMGRLRYVTASLVVVA